MASDRANKLLSLLDTQTWVTAQELAGAIGRSERTVRESMREVADVLQASGAELESRPRRGYRIHVVDEEAFGALPEAGAHPSPVPDGGRERVDYLVMGLLYLMGYVKVQDLCEIFYVSSTTLSACLKSAGVILSQYDIAVERRPNHGVRVVGDERDARRLIAERFVRNDLFPPELGANARGRMGELAEAARDSLAAHELHLTESALEALVSYCLVARSRQLYGFALELPRDLELPEVSERVGLVAADLERAMGVDTLATHTPDETRYLEVLLAGSSTVRSAERAVNFVISERTDRMAVQILTQLTRDYGIDLASNFDLRIQLNMHLAPMDIRMRFGLRSYNPLLDEIKRAYPLAFQMSMLAGRILRRHYGRDVPEDELGYIALILQVALEQGKSRVRHSILIVSGIGRSSSLLLKGSFERRFGDCLDEVYLSDPMGLSTFDFAKVDYVFTTVPLAVAVPRPVLMVGPFLDERDAQRVEDVLREDGEREICERYLGKKRFIPRLVASTREEALEELCRRVAAAEEVDANFCDLVFEREALVQMHLGNGVALPHPNGIASEKTFAYVAVLDAPVDWHGDPVLVVIMVSMGRADAQAADRQQLNELLARFALDANAVARLVGEPTYENLRALLGRA